MPKITAAAVAELWADPEVGERLHCAMDFYAAGFPTYVMGDTPTLVHANWESTLEEINPCIALCRSRGLELATLYPDDEQLGRALVAIVQARLEAMAELIQLRAIFSDN
jgi:hypothetical protein